MTLAGCRGPEMDPDGEYQKSIRPSCHFGNKIESRAFWRVFPRMRNNGRTASHRGRGAGNGPLSLVGVYCVVRRFREGQKSSGPGSMPDRISSPGTSALDR